MNKIKEIISKFENWLVSVPHDKLFHFIAGLLITSFFAIVIPFTASWCISFAIVAGLVKEAIDEYNTPMSWSNEDLFATVLGGFVIQAFVLIQNFV